MTRVLADLPDEDIAALDRMAASEGRSRAAMLREAVQLLIGGRGQERGWIDRGFGAWRERQDIGDPIAWQRRERAAWTRPWDDDYDDVRAEFPDLFSAEDDRERELYLARKRRAMDAAPDDAA